jgi:uncharacterized protein with HEPN domain
MPDDRDRLALTEIVEAADLVRTYITGMDEALFLADRKTCDAVSMQVFVLAEAAGRLSDAGRAHLGAFDWRQIRGLRNRIAHGYGTVDFRIIWMIASVDLPDLGAKARDALDGAGNPGP